VTGKVLAVSPNGSVAVFSDTFHTPNQVFVVNTAGASSSTTALNISGATVAAFSPDGLKAFIIGCKAGQGQCVNGGDSVYIYSALQALQPPLPTPSATAIGFSSNGAFAFVSGGASSPAITAYRVCDNSSAVTINLTNATVSPTFLKVLPDGIHLIGLDNTGLDYITTAITAVVPPTQCPQAISGSSIHIELGQGTFNPVAFFVSTDGTRVYVVASDRSIVMVYDFNTGAVRGIPLVGNATPVVPKNSMFSVADMPVDGTLIYVAGSDGTLHELSTVSETDMLQISFPNLSNHSNPFCTLDPTQGPCKLNFVAVRP
jgi:WD40 repeat protein